MKNVVIGSTVYSNGNNNFSLDSAKVTGISVVNDTVDGPRTWINLEGGGEERSLTPDVFFRNYTDVLPFFKLGVTYQDECGSLPARFEITELLKSGKPTAGHQNGLYAVAKRIERNGSYSYIILDESSFGYMVQV